MYWANDAFSFWRVVVVGTIRSSIAVLGVTALIIGWRYSWRSSGALWGWFFLGFEFFQTSFYNLLDVLLVEFIPTKKRI